MTRSSMDHEYSCCQVTDKTMFQAKAARPPPESLGCEDGEPALHLDASGANTLQLL